MKMIPVVGIGAGGHSAVMIEAIRLAAEFEVVALVDHDPSLIGADVLGVKVVGDDGKLKELLAGGLRHAFLGVGSVGRMEDRGRLIKRILDLGFELITVVHPSAYISPSAVLGRGVSVLAKAVVNARSAVGDHSIVNTGALVEHDCVVGSNVHVASGAVVCGGVKVGADSLVGAGSVIRQYLQVGDNAVIGAGSVVVSNVASSSTVLGVPARSVNLYGAVQLLRS